MKLMKKVALGVVAVAVVGTVSSTSVFAANSTNGDIFGGIKVDNSLSTPPQTLPDTGMYQLPSVTPGMNELNGNNETLKLQEALSNLDSASATIRNDLSQAQQQYIETDKRFKQVKLERKYAKNQVKSIRKKLKDIDAAKKKIKKNMTKGL